ncbi:hypothetical protein [Pseudomonas sp. 10S4]|uniref:hypothetical protein n=1 Tax=Pseudomonas sp. 10S4 TaxID=3048583 RepID=UPI002B22DFBF|nr:MULTISPECIES: hypothetical protein [unclassified Pseudomonas]MEB0228422.1 hypothetical protein [Pseudomonas sp. 5S1]MEB0298966.1 hypothetical protein [Pseudomonas sp. 10S4]
MQWELPLAGFLSSEVDEAVPAILQANEELFALAKDVNHLIMAIAQEALNTVHTSSMDEGAVLVRLLMRAAGFYQGALLMAERGMYVECRAMARSVIEVSLAVAAMDGDRVTFMQMLRDDHLKSRRNRYQTLFTHSTDPKSRKALQAAIGQLEKSLSLMSPKAVAALGPLKAAYHTYQVLSDNAGHVSASSLDHFIEPQEDRKFWSYKVGAGAPEEIAASLYYCLYGAIPVAVGITDLLNLKQFAGQVHEAVDRFGRVDCARSL